MERRVGTISRGIRCPIIREGDNLADIVVSSVLEAAESEGFELRDRDVISVTESIVARAQGNYASVAAIAQDVKEKLGGETIGVIFPILSRNRFAICLRGIAMGAKKVVLMLSYPSDEVGNHLVDLDLVDEKGVDPYKDVLTEEKFRSLFGYHKHVFTGVDCIAYYKEVIQSCGCEVEVVLANDCRAILDYTKHILCCDIHTRERSKRLLKKAGAELVLGLDELMTAPVDGSGYNEKYGLLGSNKATEDKIKLFPRDCQPVVERIQKELGITIEPEETGTTFAENALIKAETICKACGLPTIADDSGLCVDALGGAPGVYSARYCGRHGDDEANNDKLLDAMQAVPAGQRGAKFVSAVCFILPDGRHLTCMGECPGSIAFERLCGDYGFGYDPLFIPTDCGVGKHDKRPNTEGRSYAQLTPDEKDAISHRGNALAELEKELPDFLK